MERVLFWLKTSRPGLWFATLWLYLLPTHQQANIWTDPAFLLGLVYVLFPLNFLVYGWNDIVDYQADKVNPRKDTYLFGAKGSKAQLQRLWIPITLVQLPFWVAFVLFCGPHICLLLLGFIVINGLYNLPKHGLRSKPPLELLCQIGYLLIVPLSIAINESDPLSTWAYVYLLLFAWQSHLIGEVMDIEPDRLTGKRTTATVIGRIYTKVFIIALVGIEIAIVYVIFSDLIFAGMLFFGLIWLIIDLILIYKNKVYSLTEMKLFGYLSNVVGFISMMYVWVTGCLH